MFNPLHIFESKYLDAFIKKGVKAFVMQQHIPPVQRADKAIALGEVEPLHLADNGNRLGIAWGAATLDCLEFPVKRLF